MKDCLRSLVLFIVLLPLSLLLAKQKKDTVMKPDILRGQHFANHVNIAKSEFIDVNMANAKFDTVKLSKSYFNNIDLSESNFDNINCRKAKLTNVDMSDIEISMARIGGAKFKNIGQPAGSKEKQSPVSFEDVDLNNSKLLKCDLSDVSVDSCKIEGMKIDGILVSDLLKNYKEKKK
jgi:uncharacterized protein YjbI with pentapeptide repeats